MLVINRHFAEREHGHGRHKAVGPDPDEELHDMREEAFRLLDEVSTRLAEIAPLVEAVKTKLADDGGNGEASA